MPKKSMAPENRRSLRTTSQATSIPIMPAMGVAIRASVVVSLIDSLPMPPST